MAGNKMYFIFVFLFSFCTFIQSHWLTCVYDSTILMIVFSETFFRAKQNAKSFMSLSIELFGFIQDVSKVCVFYLQSSPKEIEPLVVFSEILI